LLEAGLVHSLSCEGLPTTWREGLDHDEEASLGDASGDESSSSSSPSQEDGSDQEQNSE
jgi:hypothetical protein